jgi:hypothetical protein
MAKTGVSKFRFVSPGVQIAEIDNSQLPKDAEPIGPVIIGLAERGPALRPVKVNSFSDFVEIFGSPRPGNKSGDIWREGTMGLTPTYGAYAAEAWFKNASPVTFVRLLGKANSNADNTDAAKAGWKIGSSYTGLSTGGAFGLWLINSSSTDTTGTLGAIFYCNEGLVGLTGTLVGANSQTSSAGHLIHSVGTDITFKAQVRNATVIGSPGAGTVTDTITFNFNESSNNYIRKVFNTDPTAIDPNSRQYSSQKTYVLGETFDRNIKEYITNTGATTAGVGSDIGNVLGVIIPLSNAETDTNVNQASLGRASTGWVFSQDLGAFAAYSPEDLQKLFRFKTLEGGTWEQSNLKISIRDIRAAQNEFEPYGAFTVELRQASDSDNAPVVIETFANCNLNPNSSNYIGIKIGNSYVGWDDGQRRYREYGDYPNQSRYIYVEVDSKVKTGLDEKSLIPFGYFGPLRFKPWNLSSSAQALPSTGQKGHTHTFGGGTVYTNAVLEAVAATAGGTDGSPLVYFENEWTGSFTYPKTYLRNNTLETVISNAEECYFGLDTSLSGSSIRFNNSYVDAVRGLPDGYRDGDQGAQTPSNASTGDTEYSYIFSLDNVTRFSASVATAGLLHPSTTQGYYLSGSRVAGVSLSATGSSNYSGTLDAGFDKFTLPLFGGFDGIDIEERNPFNDYSLGRYNSTVQTEINNSAFNSVKMAIDACADPEVVECNMMTIPGTATPGITNHLMTVCEARADALAIVDIAGNYIPRDDRSTYYSSDSNSAVRGSVAEATRDLNARVLNNSYAATYYPWLQYRDQNLGLGFWGPPSIAAVGTYANTQNNFELWFAPAGFTRGGLSEGAAGIPVTGVKQRLTSKERDSLYEANINPIATFPAEGIVMFGQKTLQKTRSALDRVNVRRLMIYVKKEISTIASRLLFDQNVETTWDRFTGQVIPFLDSVRMRLGLEDYRVILDKTTTTPDLVDRNIMYAKIFLKPARSIEFIAIDFVITNSGAAFED